MASKDVAIQETEDEILKARQLRILRRAGVHRVDERLSCMLATGKIAASHILRGYGRLMRDISGPHATTAKEDLR